MADMEKMAFRYARLLSYFCKDKQCEKCPFRLNEDECEFTSYVCGTVPERWEFGKSTNYDTLAYQYAKHIQRYCKNRNCDDCAFSYRPDCKCIFTSFQHPRDWNFSKLRGNKYD